MVRGRLFPIYTLGVLILHTAGVALAGDVSIDRVLEANDPRWEQVRSVEFFRDRLPAPPVEKPALDGMAALGANPGLGVPDEPPPRPRGVDHGWDPFTSPLNPSAATQLLNRALIGHRYEEIGMMSELGLDGAVEYLLQDEPLPAPPGVWVDEELPDFRQLSDQEIQDLIMLYNERGQIMRLWWVERMVYDQQGVTENMTHFWHDHFANEFNTVNFPQSTWRQNRLFRTYALGNFRDLTRAVAKDPSMILYLDGFRNVAGNPNENFARELLELFTMGEDADYTQTDVAEVARACTGWTTDALRTYFVPGRHDYGRKTILGETGNYDLDDVIDIIFAQDATAEYLCAKLYRWFVDDEPSSADIRILAEVMRANDYEVKPVLRTIFMSEHLLGPDRLYGSMIRDGVDIYAGQLRRFHVQGFAPSQDIESLAARWTYFQMFVYGHILLDPPNVAGWPGHRNWINTYTLPFRKYFSTSMVDGYINERTSLGFIINVRGEVQRFSDPEDAEQLVEDLALLCYGMRPTPLVRERMLEELLQGAEVYDWSLSNPNATDRLRDLFRFTMRLPDYQLK